MLVRFQTLSNQAYFKFSAVPFEVYSFQMNCLRLFRLVDNSPEIETN